jgi:hypothetical protein
VLFSDTTTCPVAMRVYIELAWTFQCVSPENQSGPHQARTRLVTTAHDDSYMNIHTVFNLGSDKNRQWWYRTSGFSMSRLHATYLYKNDSLMLFSGITH